MLRARLMIPGALSVILRVCDFLRWGGHGGPRCFFSQWGGHGGPPH
jgi:hypothetical protein